MAGKVSKTIACCLVLFMGGCVAQTHPVDPYAVRKQREELLAEQGGMPPSKSEAQQVAEPVVPVQDMLMPTLTLINDRIYAYEQKLEALRQLQEQSAATVPSQETLNLMSECRVQLQDILVEYNALHQRLLKKTDLSAAQLLAGESLLNLTERDITYLESDCLSLFNEKPVTPQQAVTRSGTLFASEQQLRNYSVSGEFDKVISLYEQLPLQVGQQPSFDTTFLYGQALLKSRREAEARKVFTDLLKTIRQNDQAQWEFRLMQLIGDLEFGLEIYDGARGRYSELVDVYDDLGAKNEWAKQQLSALDRNVYQTEEVSAYARLLISYLSYNPDRDGYDVVKRAQEYRAKYPYSPVSSNADILLELAKREADLWLESLLVRIDGLVEEKKFQEALLLIERVPQNILPADKQEMLRRKNEQLLTAESISIETGRLVQEQELQEQWNNAMLKFEAGEYDQAIEDFTALLASSYQQKAQERIDEAARLAAVRDRQLAAEIFMRATRTTDTESKVKLLFASRKLLQEILIKYPQSGLTDKVNRNISRIEEEINAIDPTLLTSPTTVGGDLPVSWQTTDQ